MSDILATAPLAIVTITSLLAVLAETLRLRGMSLWIALAGLLAAFMVALYCHESRGTAFWGMVSTGGYANFFAATFCIAGILSMMLSRTYIVREGIDHGEYYAMLLFSIIGMMVMAAAADLVVFFVGLEMMSVSFYVLAGFARKRRESNEAGLKYFLLGAFATGFLLYGIALVYGTSGTTNIELILAGAGMLSERATFLIGAGMLLIGLGFKIAAVPFHMWVPDVYEGAPTTVTGFMSTGGKAAAFSALLIIFAPSLIHALESLREILALLAALTMVVGNVLAVSQSSVKRMLAYSSIAHAGYILAGVVAGNPYGSNGVLFYLLSYTLMNVGAFGVLSVHESGKGGGLTFEDYAGLASKQPGMAALMSLFMLSLTGIPPFAGFFSKYAVFAGAVQAGYTWLAIVGVLMSVVSAYYYLRLVVLMYFKEQVSALEAPSSRLGFLALVLSAIAIVGLGIFPSVIVDHTATFF